MTSANTGEARPGAARVPRVQQHARISRIPSKRKARIPRILKVSLKGKPVRTRCPAGGIRYALCDPQAPRNLPKQSRGGGTVPCTLVCYPGDYARAFLRTLGWHPGYPDSPFVGVNTLGAHVGTLASFYNGTHTGTTPRWHCCGCCHRSARGHTPRTLTNPRRAYYTPRSPPPPTAQATGRQSKILCHFTFRPSTHIVPVSKKILYRHCFMILLASRHRSVACIMRKPCRLCGEQMRVTWVL